jgi:pSer/pThr/pTyr-binding forkhead associated (FHA) protein
MVMTDKMPVKIVKSMKAPKEPGNHYRLLCMTGKNKGLSYFINSKRIVLGRSDKAHIQVLDGKSSREHAELALVGDGYVLTDLGSQNGVVVNDLKVSQHRLVDNDKIIIGATVYKYNQIQVEKSDLPAVVDEDSDIELFEEEEEKSKKGKKKAKGKKNNKIMILVAVLAVVFLLPEDDGGGEKNRKRKTGIGAVAREKIALSDPRNNEIQDKDVRDKLKAFIHRGQREYREGNYFRAIEQFELALILVPNHVDASFYLRKTKESLKDYLKSIKDKAQQDQDALKYTSALNQYCAIISFLQDYPEDERYKEAEKQIELLEEKLGYEKGEFKCY